MTTYGAYDAGLPCQNKSCKSYGTPHPNCRCYGGKLAEGGEVERFCSADRQHKADCEYFADGGDVASAQPAVWDDDASPIETPTPPAPPAQPAAKVWDDDATPTQSVWDDDASPVVQTSPHVVSEDLAPGEAGAQYGSFNLPPVVKTGYEIIGGTVAAEALPGTAALAEMGRLGQVGASAIKGAISNGLIQGTDEISKALLGQGNPEDAVGAILTNMGLGLLFGATGGAIGAGVESQIEKQAAKKGSGKIASWLVGAGQAADEVPGMRTESNEMFKPVHDEILGPVGGDWKAYLDGQTFMDELTHGGIATAVKKGAAQLGSLIGAEEHGAYGSMIGQMAGKLAGWILGQPVESAVGYAAKKVLAPVTWRILGSGSTAGMLDTLQNAEKMYTGWNMISRGTDALFKVGSNQAIDAYLSESERKKLDNYISEGGVTQGVQEQIYDDNAPKPNFAEGGLVKKHHTEHAGGVAPVLAQPHGFATHYPAENMLVQAGKARISHYLQSLRPGSGMTPKLAFDDLPDEATKQKAYHRAMDIAIKPAGVLEHIRTGTLEPEHMTHLKATHPEALGLMQKEVTKRITKAQLQNEKPPHHIRQGLSMLLGTPLSGEFSAKGIAAAQSVFARQSQPAQAPAQAPAKPKHRKASLSKADQAYLTGDQAREARQQKV